MPRVLITGGAGFIGQALARVLLKRGFHVRTFDMFRPQETVGEHIVGTIMYPDEIGKAAHGSEFVVHLAALLGVRRTEEQRLRCLDININGTKNVLDACGSAGVKKIVFASSSEVYGEPVNIASRIQNIAQANEIYFTEATSLSLNKAEVPSAEIGYRILKGMPQRIKI